MKWFVPTLLTFVGMLPILIGIGALWAVRRRFKSHWNSTVDV